MTFKLTDDKLKNLNETIYSKNHLTKEKPWKKAKPILQEWRKASPQTKGKVGVGLACLACEEKGISFKKENKQGDCYIDGVLVEVKTAFVNYESEKQILDNDPKVWANQIRPNQEKWDQVLLAVVHPANKAELFLFPRHVCLSKDNKLFSCGHVGTEELLQISFNYTKDRELVEPFHWLTIEL